jgi:peptide/nickel transport system substrate-binding protein
MRSFRRHHGVPNPRATRRELLGLAALGVLAAGTASAKAANGQLVYASHISLAPTWFDPAETPGIVTPFMLLYALHDGLVKPMPGNPAEPCLAESYAASADGLSHSFVLRAGVTFHNGAPVTAEDVKFSFERYRGNAAGFIKEKVAAVETPDPQRVIFRLHQPWPDFLLYYSSVTGAGWIVPKKYVESVGEDGFKKEPIGAGPYKFVSFVPGVELVMEAFDGYWRKAPTVKKLVWKVIPDETTRLAALKRGEVDLAYSIRGELAEELQRAPGLALKPVVINSPFWIYFADQWDPKSPWHDARVRKAVTLALDREGIKYYCDSSYANLGEAALNGLAEVGIRLKLRPIERAAFTKGYSEKKYRNIIQGGSGAFGNAATRMETFVVKGGAYVYGSYPDIDELFAQQAAETDRAKRAAILQRMQQLVHERTVYAPLWQLAFLNGQGRRVGESAFGLISGHPYSAPYEDVRLKNGA